MDVRPVSLSIATILLLATVGIVLAGPVMGHGPGGGVSVSVEETNAPISVGETLEVTVELENTASATRTQRAVLYIGGEVRDSETLTMEAGESRTMTLSWATESGTEGEYEAVVQVGDDTDRVAVAVQTPPSLDVEMDGTNAPINATETLVVTAAVSNTGGAEGTADVTLATDGTVRDSATVSVAGGSTQEVTLTWDTVASDEGQYDATLSMGNTTVSQSIEISEAPASPNATNDAPNARIVLESDTEPVLAGEELTFAANATDPDGEVVSYEWRIGGEQVSTNRSFTYTFEEGGNHEVRLVVVDDDGTPTTVSRTIQVQAPTTTASDSTTDTTTDTGSSGAGFGVLVTLVAISCYGLLRRWR